MTLCVDNIAKSLTIVNYSIGLVPWDTTMALETGDFISDLDETNPVPPDGLAEADDHIRLVKKVLKLTFPAITGAMTIAHAVLNLLPGRVTTTENRLNAMINDAGLPYGLIVLWYGTAATVPVNWRICDGQGGTPDLRGVFVKGCTGDGTLGSYNGTATAWTTVNGQHSHGGGTGFAGAHGHHFEVWTQGPNQSHVVESGGPDPVAGSAHLHLVVGDTWGVDNHQHGIYADGNHQHTAVVDPPHRQIYYIMKVA